MFLALTFSCLVIRLSGCGFLASGLGFRDSGLGMRVSSFGFRVSGVGLRVSGIRQGLLYNIEGSVSAGRQHPGKEAVWGLGSGAGVSGRGCEVSSLGFGTWDLGFVV